MKKKPPQKIARSIRFDVEDLKRSKILGLNLNKICREALKEQIIESIRNAD